MTATVSLRTARKKFDSAYSDPAHWTRMSILIMVRMGKFSCDRLIREIDERAARPICGSYPPAKCA
jgi:glucan phosphorylase